MVSANCKWAPRFISRPVVGAGRPDQPHSWPSWVGLSVGTAWELVGTGTCRNGPFVVVCGPVPVSATGEKRKHVVLGACIMSRGPDRTGTASSTIVVNIQVDRPWVCLKPPRRCHRAKPWMQTMAIDSRGACPSGVSPRGALRRGSGQPRLSLPAGD